MSNLLSTFTWTRLPNKYFVIEDSVIITTKPFTDLWQRTYYNFRNDNAPCFQTKTSEKYFSFSFKASFKDAKHRFDQAGLVMYLDSENWLKASVEYESEEFAHLGSVVTNNGYSDWATTSISSDIKEVWYRLSRRENDFKIEYSFDGKNYNQMRICHIINATDVINFGIYACSPEESSFVAEFSDFKLGKCIWLSHDGQKPD